MEVDSLNFFNNMDDETLLSLIEADKIQYLCMALSLDLQPKKIDKKTTYEC
jgi:hypothetical protein